MLLFLFTWSTCSFCWAVILVIYLVYISDCQIFISTSHIFFPSISILCLLHLLRIQCISNSFLSLQFILRFSVSDNTIPCNYLFFRILVHHPLPTHWQILDSSSYILLVYIISRLCNAIIETHVISCTNLITAPLPFTQSVYLR